MFDDFIKKGGSSFGSINLQFPLQTLLKCHKKKVYENNTVFEYI